jgi:CO dehydrogenase/acetyl-CoA synthase epsilon subunit
MNRHGSGMLHAKTVTSTPETVQMAVKPAKTSTVICGTAPGSTFLNSKQTAIRAHPILAM